MYIIGIEDSPQDRSLLQRAMRTAFPDAQMVIQSAAAFTHTFTGQRRPDLVITDWHLGLVNGKEIIEVVRLAAPGCPIIVWTGYLREPEEALRFGAVHVVIKSADLDPLCEAARKAVGVS